MTPRAAKWDDVKQVAGWFNDAGVTYAIFGSWAVRIWGVQRTVWDIDIIVPYERTEYEKVKTALSNLPLGKAQIADVDVWMRYATVRMVDDFVIDVNSFVRSMAYQSLEIIPVIIDGGLTIPFVSGDTLCILNELAGRYSHQVAGDYEALLKLGYNGIYENKVIAPETPEPAKDALVQPSHALVVTEDFLET